MNNCNQEFGEHEANGQRNTNTLRTESTNELEPAVIDISKQLAAPTLSVSCVQLFIEALQ